VNEATNFYVRTWHAIVSVEKKTISFVYLLKQTGFPMNYCVSDTKKLLAFEMYCYLKLIATATEEYWTRSGTVNWNWNATDLHIQLQQLTSRCLNATSSSSKIGATMKHQMTGQSGQSVRNTRCYVGGDESRVASRARVVLTVPYSFSLDLHACMGGL